MYFLLCMQYTGKVCQNPRLGPIHGKGLISQSHWELKKKFHCWESWTVPTSLKKVNFPWSGEWLLRYFPPMENSITFPWLFSWRWEEVFPEILSVQIFLNHGNTVVPIFGFFFFPVLYSTGQIHTMCSLDLKEAETVNSALCAAMLRIALIGRKRRVVVPKSPSLKVAKNDCWV